MGECGVSSPVPLTRFMLDEGFAPLGVCKGSMLTRRTRQRRISRRACRKCPKRLGTWQLLPNSIVCDLFSGAVQPLVQRVVQRLACPPNLPRCMSSPATFRLDPASAMTLTFQSAQTPPDVQIRLVSWRHTLWPAPNSHQLHLWPASLPKTVRSLPVPPSGDSGGQRIPIAAPRGVVGGPSLW
jgi:hypothetical protein